MIAVGTAVKNNGFNAELLSLLGQALAHMLRGLGLVLLTLKIFRRHMRQSFLSVVVDELSVDELVAPENRKPRGFFCPVELGAGALGSPLFSFKK